MQEPEGDENIPKREVSFRIERSSLEFSIIFISPAEHVGPLEVLLGLV
jgi:hypothetical protein